MIKRLLELCAPVLFLISCSTEKSEDNRSFHSQDPGFVYQEILKTRNPNTGAVEADKLWNYLLRGKQQLSENKLDKVSQVFTNTWRPVDDKFASLSVMRIVPDLQNPGTMYFCTGEGFINESPSKAASVDRGAGVWKSEDFGETWNLLPSTMNDDFMFAQDMLVHPITGDIYVATLFNGLMRSQDAGQSWTTVLGLVAENAETNRVADIEVTKDGNLMVTLGVFDTDGIYFSETGDTDDWEKRNSGIGGSFTRIEIATAPSLEGRAYAITTNPSNNNRIGGVWRTDDNGQAWTEVAMPGGRADELARRQAWYDLIVKVDPNDPEVVLAGGLNVWRSRDSGDSWQLLFDGTRHKEPNMQYVHVDQHEIVFQNSDTVYFGNDGGIYRSQDMTADTPYFENLNLNYNVTQYYSCAIHPEEGHHFIFGGTQDNGSSGSTTQGISEWDKLSWADGGYCAIDPNDGEVFFTTTQYVRCYRFLGDNIDTITNPNISDNTTLFINPLEIDPVSGDILYQASTIGLWRLKNNRTAQASDWEQASRSIGALSAIGVATNIPNTVFVGRTGGGRVYRIDNADQTDRFYFPENVDPNNELPGNGYCSAIFVDPKDANHVIVSYSNYGIESIWESKDAMGGTPSWQNVEGDLPDLPVRWTSLHPDNPSVCYAATDAGVFMTTKLNGEETKWVEVNEGMPNVRVDMIRYRPSDNTFVAGTHGRGMFTGIPRSDYSIKWEERGPRNVGGRTRTILIDPWNPSGKELWAGSVSGGLWHVDNVDEIAETKLVYDDFSVTVFPNPNPSSQLYVKAIGSPGVRVKAVIYDLSGKTIGEKEFEIKANGEGVLKVGNDNGSSLSAGYYFVQITAPNYSEVFKILYQ